MGDDVEQAAVVAIALAGDIFKVVFELLETEAPHKDFSGFGVFAVGGIAAGHGDFVQVALKLDTGTVDEVLVFAVGCNRGGLGEVPEMGGLEVGVNDDLAFGEQASNLGRASGAAVNEKSRHGNHHEEGNQNQQFAPDRHPGQYKRGGFLALFPTT